MTAFRVPRRFGLAAISALVGASALVSFAESYRGRWVSDADGALPKAIRPAIPSRN